MPTVARKPRGLAVEGSELWDEIVGKYDLRPDEVRILADACREADMIERLEVAQAGAGLTVRGSQGQEVASPFVSELRQHRTVLAGLLKSLKLPDTDAQGLQKEQLVSEQNRAAARARWDRPRKASA